MFELGPNRYGKSRVRVMRVDRTTAPHRVEDWTVELWLTGDFSSCFIAGDNSRILPTDTMKNTVYSFARSSAASSIEAFALELTSHFLRTQTQVDGSGVRILSTSWSALNTASGTHNSTFGQLGSELATTSVTRERAAPPVILSGLENLTLLKTANSGFSGFLRDPFTTLRETEDRLLGTVLAANWLFADPSSSFADIRSIVRDALLETFATHTSSSVQQTLYAMAQAALSAAPCLREITLSMPNKHCNLVDLSPFSQTNPNHIFVPTDEPHGSIQATVRRPA